MFQLVFECSSIQHIPVASEVLVFYQSYKTRNLIDFFSTSDVVQIVNDFQKKAVQIYNQSASGKCFYHHLLLIKEIYHSTLICLVSS